MPELAHCAYEADGWSLSSSISGRGLPRLGGCLVGLDVSEDRISVDESESEPESVESEGLDEEDESISEAAPR